MDRRLPKLSCRLPTAYVPAEIHEFLRFPPDQNPWPAYTVCKFNLEILALDTHVHIGDFFPAAFNCPHELERIGSLGDGGKWTCGVSRIAEKPDCIIYSFGAYYMYLHVRIYFHETLILLGTDWESAWEASVLENTEHCEIWGYDHQTKSFGRQVSHASFSNKHRTHFTSHVQLGPIDKHASGDDPKLYKLDTLMNKNGHTFIDILKVDIEGYEFDTLKAIVQPYIQNGEPLPFGQLQIELHVWSKKFSDFLTWWEMLEAAGLRPVMMEPNLVYVNYNRQSGAELAEVRRQMLSLVNL